MRQATRWMSVGILLSVFFTAPAHAQEQEQTGPFREPGISYLEGGRPWLQWVAGSLFIAACLLAAFKNPHRSHLD